MRKLFYILLLSLLQPSLYAKTQPKGRVFVPKAPILKEQVPVQVQLQPKFHRLDAIIGINLSKGSALVSGFNYAYRITSKAPVFVGVEANFLLYSPGSVLGVMAGSWSQYYPFKDPNLGFAFGIIGGAGFTENLSFLKSTTYAVFLDASVLQRLDELVDLKAQFRPGLLGGHLALMFNLNASFRL